MTEELLKPASKTDSEDPVVRNSRWKWLVLGIAFFLCICGIVFFASDMSRIQKIEVTGHELIPEQEIIKSSGLLNGEQFLFFAEQDTESAVERLNAFAKINVAKSFPGRVHIRVEEFPIVAYMIEAPNKPELVMSSGKRLPLKGSNIPDKPLLTGWGAAEHRELLANMAQTLQNVKPLYLSDVSEIRLNPSPAFSERIFISTRSGYEVESNIKDFPKNIEYLPEVVLDLRKNNNTEGAIDMTLKKPSYRSLKLDENKGTTQNDNKMIQ